MPYYKRIRELREDHDMTQNDVAKYLGMKRLVILVTSSPSCAVLRTSQISLAVFNPCTFLYSSRHKEARSIEVSWELKCRIWVASSES